MSLKTLPNTDLIIDIPGTMQIGSVTYKRKIKVITLLLSFIEKIVRTEGIVIFYDENDVQITDTKFIRSYGIMMVADNNTMVDATTGAILTPTITQVQDTNGDGTFKIDANGDPVMVDVISYPGDYMGQFDWFYNVANTVPIVLNEMIEQFYVKEINEGKFN